MKINRVYIKNFGGITNREYILSDGLNVVFGKNESGKSTFLAFICFIFYGAKKTRGKELSFREKYMPWSGEDMCGEVEFTLNETVYSLSRTVSASGRKKDVKLVNKSTGEVVQADNIEEIGTDVFNMSEQSFLKTLFIGAEGTKIDSDGELLSKISNVSQSGDESVSYQFILDKINNLISDLSSPRRSKAIIPALEKSLLSLREKYQYAKKLKEDRLVLSEQLERINKELDRALNQKSELNELIKSANKYNDCALYEEYLIKLKEAEKTYKELLTSNVAPTDNNDFIKDITDEEEQIILNDNSVQITAGKMQEVLLNDKLKTASKLKIFFGIISAISLPFAFISPISLLCALIFLIISLFFFKSSKGIKEKIDEISKKIESIEKEKSEILKKYNLDSAEHYKELKRDVAERNAKVDSENSRLNMAKRIYEERKDECDKLFNKLTEKYGDLENAKCEKTIIDENSVNKKIADINDNILRFTEERAKIKSSIESSENISEELSDLSQEIKDNELLLAESNEKLKVLNLASEILTQSYEEMKSNFAPKLARATIDIFNSLNGGKYGELIVNDAFEIQVKHEGKYENSNYFSSGTIQQLYFSLRLGIIDLIADNLPLFIDDAFITYDDDRFSNATKFLNDYSRNNQVVFCTCHLRESSMEGAHVLKF